MGGLGPKVFFETAAAPSTDVYSGDYFTVSVDVGGTPNLSYQWYKQGVGAISGATTSAYTKDNCQSGDTGTYYCTVTNLYGSITSSGLLVTVNQSLQPAIVTPPSGRTLYTGGTLNLSEVASGGGLRYQWSKNSSLISGATASAYQILRVTNTDAGSYSVVVTNSAGQASAGPAVISIPAPANAYEIL